MVSTALGTWAWVTPERVRLHWPECVRRDFDWRAIHLMAVYGRKIVELFYGRPPRRMYFNGGSTGGRQALSEAIRFPEDFDGIIARVCANMAVVNEAAIFHLWRATHDSGGKALFTPEQMTTVADAAVEYMKTRDPAPYAGEVVADGRWSAITYVHTNGACNPRHCTARWHGKMGDLQTYVHVVFPANL